MAGSIFPRQAQKALLVDAPIGEEPSRRICEKASCSPCKSDISECGGEGWAERGGQNQFEIERSLFVKSEGAQPLIGSSRHAFNQHGGRGGWLPPNIMPREISRRPHTRQMRKERNGWWGGKGTVNARRASTGAGKLGAWRCTLPLMRFVPCIHSLPSHLTRVHTYTFPLEPLPALFSRCGPTCPLRWRAWPPRRARTLRNFRAR